MRNLDPTPTIKRWLISRSKLNHQIESLRREIEHVRARNAELIKAKASAEKQVDSLRREKETLRAKVASQKKSTESTQHVIEQLSAKNTELRDEIERLRNAEKARNQRKP